MMEQKINRETLRYHVSRKMFCECGDILDVRSAVSFTLERNGQHLMTAIACTKCFDRKVAPKITQAVPGLTVEVLDGRSLYPTRTRARKQTQRQSEVS